MVTHTYTHTYTHTHIHTHDNYYNPRCAHAHRGLTTVTLSVHARRGLMIAIGHLQFTDITCVVNILENATVLGKRRRVLHRQFCQLIEHLHLHVYICHAEYHIGWIFRYT